MKSRFTIKHVTSSVLVVDTKEKNESLRPRVLPSALLSNLSFFTDEYNDENRVKQ